MPRSLKHAQLNESRVDKKLQNSQKAGLVNRKRRIGNDDKTHIVLRICTDQREREQKRARFSSILFVQRNGGHDRSVPISRGIVFGDVDHVRMALEGDKA
jgi:hypothetical protein